MTYWYSLALSILIQVHTVFTPGNSFKKAQIELYKKACHTFFSYLSGVNVQAGAQVSTVRKLFNTLLGVPKKFSA